MIRRRNRKPLPELNMASLPDLIFTVLFFFMIVTTMRSVPLWVKMDMPQGKELTKLKKKKSTLYLLVGHPINSKTDSIVVQVDNEIVPVERVGEKVMQYYEQLLPDEQEEMVVAVKIDKNTPMGIVNDVKIALREAGALKVHYTAAAIGK